jgi:hypothetical protein
MKYDPFLIFWWLFCRNLRKIENENEVCFEACRMPNFFLIVLRFFEKIMNCFQIHHNLQLAYILSFQKRYKVPRKYLTLKSYSRKCGHRSHFFQQNSTLEPKFTTKFLKFRIQISVLYFTT